MTRLLYRLIFATLAMTSLAHGQLVITEINSNGTPGDFWELTNYGASTVNISGYKWDDDSANPLDAAAYTVPANSFIAPGESIIFSVTTSPAVFRTAWNLPPTVQVFTGGPSLGQNDRVYLFNSTNFQITNRGYAASAFTTSNGSASLGGHAGISAGGTSADQSMIIDPNFSHLTPRFIFASGGNFSSFAANAPNTGIGSPGTVGIAGTNSLPVFQAPTTSFWTSGLTLTTSAFRVIASDSDVGQTATLSVISAPAWLTFTADGVGRYRLNGTPPAPGDYSYTIRATDNAAVPGFTDQTFTLSVFPASSPLYLNEYNAVSDTNFLNGGTLTLDADLASPGASDAHFGRVLGNGGQWLEFVVVGNGTANSTTDMRGWKIDIHSLDGSSTIVLSQHAYWSNVRAGTILTFIKNGTADGGLDTQIHRTSALHAAGGGFVWSNINTSDPIFISQANSSIGNNLGIGSTGTQVSIRNAADVRVYGPSGEGVAADPATQVPYGVGSTETLRVETNPTTTINPFSSPHNDGSTFSTFGARNRWSAGTITQSFASFVSTNSPPRFTSVPPSTRITSSFTYNITSTDPNGQTATLTASSLPSFLTFTPGSGGTATITTNRALTLADAGEHIVEVIANDGQAVANTTPQTFIINVYPPSSPVILNEYNAVSSTEYFNGGDALNDSDLGTASTDSYFNRIPGNGGNWFELVITGSGGPSTVDLRGWSIEIGTSNNGQFLKSNTIVLSNHSTWAAVQAGTILTFIERNTAHGGLDTGIKLRNTIHTTGHAWTNVWLGDPTLLVYTSPITNGYTVTGNTVSDVVINQDNTQFILKNTLGERVFGPSGEGIAPASGVSSSEICALHAHPLPTTSALTESINFSPGYSDASSHSSFGLPNQWLDALSSTITQSFTPYIAPLTPYDSWTASFGLSGNNALATADSDLDQRNNLSEYAFGGNPTLADAPPAPTFAHNAGNISWQFAFRNDPSLNLIIERSTSLTSWATVSLTPINSAHPTLSGFFLSSIDTPANPVDGREFFRTTVTQTP